MLYGDASKLRVGDDESYALPVNRAMRACASAADTVMVVESALTALNVYVPLMTSIGSSNRYSPVEASDCVGMCDSVTDLW